MELRGGGILPSEGKNNQAPGVWVPVTPSKPEQLSRRIYRLQSDSTSGGGLCSSSTSDNSVTYFGARGVTNQVQNLNNWGVCNLTVNTPFPGLNVSPCVNNGGAGNLSSNHELSGLSVSSHLNHSGAGNWPPRTQLSTLSVISPHDNYRRSNLPSQTHQLDLNINTQVQVTKNPTAECSKIPWNQLVQMAVEGRRNGSVSSFPILGDQVVGTQSNMANPLLINHSSSHASHIWSNNGNYTQQLPIGFHFPFHATSTAPSQQTLRTHQTSPKPNLGVLENGTNSFQLMPGAPDSASWRSRSCQSVECTNLFLAGKLNQTNSSEKRNEDCLANKTGQTNQSYLLIDLSSEKDRLHAVELPSSATESTVLKETLASQPNDCFRDFSQPVEQSPSSLQSTTTLNEARNIQQDQGFDLNQTPPQKAKRKKHRPKVVTEGKRKRNLTTVTPTKVKTPKQAKTPRPITPKQAPREKRKYVRKTKGIPVEDVRMFEKEHLMINLDVRPDKAEQATPPADGRIGVESLPLRGWPKSSCRRVLNFDLEAEGDTIRSSCRRTPNFDLEDQTGKNRGGAGPINVGVQSQSQNSNSQPLGLQCTINLNFPTETQNSQSQPPCSLSQREDDGKDSGSLYSEPSRSNLLFGEGQEVTEVIEVIVENPSRYITGDSFTQVGGYTSQPQTHKPLAPLPRTKLPKENMKVLARNKNQKNVPPFMHMDQTDYTLLRTPDSSRNNLVDSLLPGLRSGLRSVARTEINLNLPVGSADVDIMSNGSKRGYIETITSPDPHCLNPDSATYHELIQEDNAQFPDSFKKQRAEAMHSEALSITPSKVKDINHCGSFRLEVSNERRRQQTQSNFLEENYVRDSNDSNFLCEGYLQSMPLDFKFSAHNASRRELSSMLTHEGIQLLDRLPDMGAIEGSNPVEKNMKENNKALDLICNLSSMAAITEDRQFPPPCEHEVNMGDQALINCANLKTKKSESEIGKHNKKRPANVVELVSSSSTNNIAPEGHKARSDYTQTFPEYSGNLGNKCDMKHSSGCNTVPIHFVNDLQNTSSTLSPVVASPKGPIGEVVQRLKCFNIDGGGEKFMPEPHTALVPYSLGGHIVPYDGNPAKKRRRPRPKVYLDKETNRVWKLLMWKEGSENIEETGPEKAKQWEEERQVFVGRANSFIARMHLVQGDRRFSPWKGSVVDSVIGVFLTQNVSDHLSSSAFMALAAKFPFHSQASSHHSSEGIRKPPEESELSLLGVEKWEGEVLNHAACNQSFTSVNEAGTSEEKEMTSSIEPFGSNIWHGTDDGANGKQVLVCDNGPPLHRELSQDRTDIPTLLEDIVSSQNSVSPQNSTNSGPQIIDQIGSIFDYNSEVVNSMTLFQGEVFNGSSTFMELLQLEGPQIIQELYCYEDGFESSNATTRMESEKRRLEFNGGLDSPCPSIYQMNVPQTQRKREFTLPTNSVVASEEVDHVEISTYESTSSLTSAISETSRAQGEEKASWLAMENMADSMVPPLSCSQNASVGDSPFVKEPVHSILVSDHRSLSDTLQSKRNSGVLQLLSNSSCCNNLGEKSDIRDQSDIGDNNRPDKLKQAESNTKDARCGYEQGFKEATGDSIRKEKKRAETRKAFDWDSLRRQFCSNGAKKQRRPETMDSLDYEALRSADVHEISNTIKERGMNNMLAERIKDFLNRLLREHGSVDLEWLRDVPPDKAKDYLLSIRGLGLKSVECVRLLTLHHVAFPVDTNVGRICVRLGWVPLQPLPESLQLHLLEMYPVLESIQKYLWPRLCKLDQRTLYELHYQMITFGKVFCTKSKPNCNACPMRAECKHFASAFASARLALPGPEEKSLVTSAVPLCTDRGHKVFINPIPLPQLKMAPYPQVDARVTRCEPIIEEPASPEAEGLDGSEIAIEDAFWEDESDEIPVIKLNFEEFSQNVQNYMHENMSLQEGDMSKALVALTPEAASIPVPKLKNVSRLRTEHQVYELPDSHELLKGLDLREPDDPCPYLLAIWTPGETAESVLPPEMFCNFRESGDLCDEKTCFACNSIREAHTQIVRGTLLMPCRTAMRGSFPLNGTYFQVNEVFADHDSSLQPIDVPRALLWNLPRRTVYFGSSVTTIFRGLKTEEIQQCFWRGFVCVRGFDREKRVPRPLMARLHLPASKLVKEPKGPKSVTGRAGERTKRAQVSYRQSR